MNNIIVSNKLVFIYLLYKAIGQYINKIKKFNHNTYKKAFSQGIKFYYKL